MGKDNVKNTLAEALKPIKQVLNVGVETPGGGPGNPALANSAITMPTFSEGGGKLYGIIAGGVLLLVGAWYFIFKRKRRGGRAKIR